MGLVGPAPVGAGIGRRETAERALSGRRGGGGGRGARRQQHGHFRPAMVDWPHGSCTWEGTCRRQGRRGRLAAKCCEQQTTLPSPVLTRAVVPSPPEGAMRWLGIDCRCSGPSLQLVLLGGPAGPAGVSSFAPVEPFISEAMQAITPHLSQELSEGSPFHTMAQPGTPSTSSGVCQRLWSNEEVQASVMKSLHHPFVRALAAGSLPRWVGRPTVVRRCGGSAAHRRGSSLARCLPRPPRSTLHANQRAMWHVWGTWQPPPCCLG